MPALAWRPARRNMALGLIMAPFALLILASFTSVLIEEDGLSPSNNEVRMIGSTGCKVWMDKERTLRRYECPAPLSLSKKSRRDPLVSDIEKRIGGGGIICGYVGFGDDARAALECGRRAQESQVPFVVAFQRQSWDTEAWEAAVLTESSERYIVRYETDPSGDMEIAPSFRWELCEKFEFLGEPLPGFLCRK